MAIQHATLAAGRWGTFSLFDQMGNIGSEVGRARKWQGKDEKRFEGAVSRALELMDLTLQDVRWRNRLKELVRAREALCDAVEGGSEYGSTLEQMDRYFHYFAVAARRRSSHLPAYVRDIGTWGAGSESETPTLEAPAALTRGADPAPAP